MQNKLKISYWSEERANYEDKEFPYPTEKELLEIFPEAKELIPLKLKEWEAKPDSDERDYHIKRLKKLQLLQDFKESGKTASWDMAFEKAKNTPIQELYPFKKLRRTGRGWEACCPFHNDKTPSFVIYSDNKWRCYGGCKQAQNHGDAIDFVRLLNDSSVKEAVIELGGAK